MTAQQQIPLDTVLDTSRCLLRVVCESDIDFVWSATRFPGFNNAMTWDPPKDPHELIEVTRRNLQSWAEGHEFAFTIVEKSSNARIGRILIRLVDPKGIWSFGYWIHPENWGKGFAVESARALIEFGFSRLGAYEIRVSHATSNTQSRRVIEKLRLRFVGENPCGFMKQGQPLPELDYSITKEEYAGFKRGSEETA